MRSHSSKDATRNTGAGTRAGRAGHGHAGHLPSGVKQGLAAKAKGARGRIRAVCFLPQACEPQAHGFVEGARVPRPAGTVARSHPGAPTRPPRRQARQELCSLFQGPDGVLLRGKERG